MSVRSIRTSHTATVLVALLMLCMVLAGALAWQAYTAVLAQRATAEGVLRDYAGLAAEEFIRRSATEIGFYGFLPLVSELGRWPDTGSSQLSDWTSRMQDSGDEKVGRALQLAARFLRYWPGDARIETSAAELAADLTAWTRRRLDEAIQSRDARQAPFIVLTFENGSTVRTFVFAELTSDDGSTYFPGFEVAVDQYPGWLREAYERGGLLPATLIEDPLARDALYLRAFDTRNRDLLVVGSRPTGNLLVTRQASDDYGGALRGMRLEAALNPAVADEVVIGGMPGARLPLVGGLLLLTSALLIISIVQVWRERALARLREDFISRVSHELRTPLTQIRIYAETLLLDRTRSTEEAHKALTVIDRESNRLSNLVTNLLRFQAAKFGAVELHSKSLDLVATTRHLVEELEPLVPGRLMFESNGLRSVCVEIDADALRQILSNLVDNAAKYGPPEQTVQVAVQAALREVSISVEDEGPGIPAGERRRAWDPYYRCDSGSSRNVPGTGIGLAVVRDLVTRHRGRCLISEGGAGGARCTVTFPRSDCPGGVG
ncbi:MAG: sensor histidine kinase [Gammaproteobacteria bacterium]